MNLHWWDFSGNTSSPDNYTHLGYIIAQVPPSARGHNDHDPDSISDEVLASHTDRYTTYWVVAVSEDQEKLIK